MNPKHYDELTINERQKKDSEFANLLNDVRVNCLSEKTIACLQRTVINCKPFEKFVELQASGQQFPVCLLATRKACDQFNSTMLDRAGSQVVKIACIDEYDETAGVKWTMKASAALEKLNRDCNNTAGLEAELTIAVGALVMLRRKIDTGRGLVNGALGCVSAISKDSIEVLFDHYPTSRVKIQSVKSKFQVMKRFYVLRKQFPLILAYAITIHKSQGISLDCAIVDLSQDVFATGMAYVALSRVRSFIRLVPL